MRVVIIFVLHQCVCLMIVIGSTQSGLNTYTSILRLSQSIVLVFGLAYVISGYIWCMLRTHQRKQQIQPIDNIRVFRPYSRRLVLYSLINNNTPIGTVLYKLYSRIIWPIINVVQTPPTPGCQWYGKITYLTIKLDVIWFVPPAKLHNSQRSSLAFRRRVMCIMWVSSCLAGVIYVSST